MDSSQTLLNQEGDDGNKHDTQAALLLISPLIDAARLEERPRLITIQGDTREPQREICCRFCFPADETLRLPCGSVFCLQLVILLLSNLRERHRWGFVTELEAKIWNMAFDWFKSGADSWLENQSVTSCFLWLRQSCSLSPGFNRFLTKDQSWASDASQGIHSVFSPCVQQQTACWRKTAAEPNTDLWHLQFVAVRTRQTDWTEQMWRALKQMIYIHWGAAGRVHRLSGHRLQLRNK